MADRLVPTSNAVCAHEGCSCVVAGLHGAVQRDGEVYCSEGCANGEGCHHETCTCSEKHVHQSHLTSAHR